MSYDGCLAISLHHDTLTGIDVTVQCGNLDQMESPFKISEGSPSTRMYVLGFYNYGFTVGPIYNIELYFTKYMA